MLFGKRLRELREQNNLVLRQVAVKLDIDTATMSKIERSDRHAKKEHIPQLARLFNISISELRTLWLVDKVYDIIGEEDEALQVLQVAEERINNKRNIIEK